MGKMLQYFRNLFAREVPPKEQNETFYQALCGHKTKIVDTIEIFGHHVEFTVGFEDGRPNYCIECISKMVIRCAWCGKPIFPDEPITLYPASDESFVPPDYAVSYQDGSRKCFVGCLRWICVDTGGDRAGYWVPPGKVKRMATPLELAAELDAAVVVNDLSNQDEKPTIVPIK